jgi:hypothetical protein
VIVVGYRFKKKDPSSAATTRPDAAAAPGKNRASRGERASK